VKNFSFLSVLILVFIVSTSSAQVIIQQDFSSPIFPPTGWTIHTEDVDGSWIWTDSGQSGDGYAHGEIVINQPCGGYSALKTNIFMLSKGDTLQIEFNRRNNFTGATPDSCQWIVALGNRANDYYSSGHPPTEGQTWVPTDHHFSIPYSSDQWYVSWTITCSTTQSEPTTIYFDVDDVLIEETGDNIQPTSLGNIKAVFY
jgi:hypothetical protein